MLAPWMRVLALRWAAASSSASDGLRPSSLMLIRRTSSAMLTLVPSEVEAQPAQSSSTTAVTIHPALLLLFIDHCPSK